MSYTLLKTAIPFDWEKYKSGKYEAITRGGYKPNEVVYLKGSKMQPLFVFFLLVYDAIIIFIKYIFEKEFKA